MDRELERLFAEAKAKWEVMTPQQRDDMMAAQRAGYVAAEMSWPEPRFKWVDGVKVYESYEDYCND